MNQQRQPAVEVARAQLARALGCAAQDLNVVSVDEVEWSDSSLGCPQPGMMYMQVITPGYRVVLEHGGQQYTMHTDSGRRAVRCDSGGDGRASRLR